MNNAYPQTFDKIPYFGNLLCFSHLRWNFVYQRPQHLLSRAAESYRVWYIEEPIFEGAAEPRLDVKRSREHVNVVVSILPATIDPPSTEPLLRTLIDGLVASLPAGPVTLWYYTPM